MWVNLTNPVTLLREELSQRTGVPRDQFQIWTNGVIMEESKTIEYYQLSELAIMAMRPSLAGGGKEKDEEEIDAVLKRRQSDKCRLTRARNKVLIEFAKEELDANMLLYEMVYEEVLERWTGGMEIWTDESYRSKDRTKIETDIIDIETKKAEINELLKERASGPCR